MNRRTHASSSFRLAANDMWWLFALLACVFVSRLLFAEPSPLSWDAASFFCAAEDFNITEDRPHLPGYFLHVLLIRLFRLFLHPFLANLAPSLLWSTLCGIPLFAFMRSYVSLRNALLCTALLLVNPMLWFYGCVSEIYAFDAFFSLTVLVLSRSPRHTSALFIALALGAGVRQSSAVLMLPLAIWCVVRHIRQGSLTPPHLLRSSAFGLSAVALWFIPFLQTCGGIGAYLRLYDSHPPGAIVSPQSNIVSMIQHALYALAIPCAVLVWHARKQAGQRETAGTNEGASRERNRPPITTSELLVWIVPAVLMFLFTTYTKGYFLIITAAPVVALMLYREVMRGTVLVAGIVVQTVLFLAVPHVMPGMDLVMAPRHGVSKWQKAAERVTSVFSMTRSRLIHERGYMRVTDSLLKSRPELSVFVDPAYPLTARALQAVYPQRELCMQYTYERNGVLVHTGIRQRKEQGMARRLQHSVILTTREACTVQPHLRPLAERDGLVLAMVDSLHAPEVAEWYDRMFTR